MTYPTRKLQIVMPVLSEAEGRGHASLTFVYVMSVLSEVDEGDIPQFGGCSIIVAGFELRDPSFVGMTYPTRKLQIVCQSSCVGVTRSFQNYILALFFGMHTIYSLIFKYELHELGRQANVC